MNTVMDEARFSVRLPDELRPPFSADERRVWDRGARLIRLGQTVPVPFLRPWLRRRGRAMQERSGWWTDGPRVVITDWVHAPLYSVIDLQFEPAAFPPPLRTQLWWWLRDRGAVIGMLVANQLGLDHISDLPHAIRRRAEQWGIW